MCSFWVHYEWLLWIPKELIIIISHLQWRAVELLLNTAVLRIYRFSWSSFILKESLRVSFFSLESSCFYSESVLLVQLHSSFKSTSKAVAQPCSFTNGITFLISVLSLSVHQLALYNTSERLINFKACWETFKGRVTPTWQKECKGVIFMTVWQVNSESKDILGLWFCSWVVPPVPLAFENSAVLHIRGNWLETQREWTACFRWAFPLDIGFHESFTSLENLLMLNIYSSHIFNSCDPNKLTS